MNTQMSTDLVAAAPQAMTAAGYLRVLEIRVPAHTRWQTDSASQLLTGLFSLPTALRLRIEADGKTLRWLLIVPSQVVTAAQQTLYSLYPQAEIIADVAYQPAIEYRLFQFRGTQSFPVPFKYLTDFSAQVDSLATLLTALATTQPGEHVIYEIGLDFLREKQPSLGRKSLVKTDVKFSNFWTGRGMLSSSVKTLAGGNNVPRYDTAIQRLCEEKLGRPLRETTVALKFRMSDARIRHFLSLLEPAFAPFARDMGNSFVAANNKQAFPLVLSPDEVAMLWHLPHDQCSQSGIAWAESLNAPLPNALKEASGTAIGSNVFQGRKQQVTLATADRRLHVNLIGKTGVGKSTLMHWMAHQDIAQGRGVAVIDPHGDLVADILRSSIPPEREADVVVFSLRDTAYPIGLNLFTGGLEASLAAAQTLAVIRKLFADQWSATRMEDALYAALLALQTYQGATIQDVPRLFNNPGFRQKVLARVDDPVALEYWLDEYETLSRGQQQQVAQPINNRIRKFYRSRTLRRIICQQDSINFRQLLDGKKIFLADLGTQSEIEAETIGALLMAKFQMAAMSRADADRKQRHPYYLYVDEVQLFATTSLPRMFAEARKYGLALTVGNQFLSQLEGPTLEAVLGNVGTTIMFRVGNKDARVLAPFVKPAFDADDLLNLNRFQTAVKMQRDGQTLPAFTMHTFPPPTEPDDVGKRADRIKGLSRVQYARAAADVEADLRQHLNRPQGSPESDDEPTDYFG